MQYYSGTSGYHYTPLVGVVPQETHNYMTNKMYNPLGYTTHPSFFPDYSQSPNQFMFNNPAGLSRQSTMFYPRMNTSVMRQVTPGIMPFRTIKAPAFFRRRNSTNPVRYANKANAFRRSNTSATNTRKAFVPKVYTTDVYPFKIATNKEKRGDVNQIFGSPFSNASTIVSRNSSSNNHEADRSGHASERSYLEMRPNKSKRNPNFKKSSPLDKALKSLKNDFHLPKIDPKEAAQFFEGLVLTALSVVKSIVSELRADIIAGMFISEGPDYNAARSNYYTKLNEKFRNSGVTERIDYIEAIENINKTRMVEKKESVRIETMREYKRMGNRDFMDMNEKEFEEFLLRQAYPNVPQYAPNL